MMGKQLHDAEKFTLNSGQEKFSLLILAGVGGGGGGVVMVVEILQKQCEIFQKPLDDTPSVSDSSPGN